MTVTKLGPRARTAAALRWVTRGGVEVSRTSLPVDPAVARAELVTTLDERRGLLLSCASEQPGRYRPADLGYVDPPIEVTACGGEVTARALNARGRVLLPAVAAAWEGLPDLRRPGDAVRVRLTAPPDGFAEEERTRQPSVFTAIRALVRHFSSPADPLLGLYGAFGYDLVFQLDPMPLRQPRSATDRDLVLHLPDVLVEIDPVRHTAVRHSYDFRVDDLSTDALDHDTPARPLAPPRPPVVRSDHSHGEYARVVRLAQEEFRQGRLFEVVPGRSLHRPRTARPSTVFDRLAARNPAPYGLLMNLGDGEHLVGASPEMFVRVSSTADSQGRRRVESCPISGTIARGADVLADADQIRELLNSAKDEAELTMCTDVDRNDKARVCEPGSVRLLGRRQVELYSTLIHTVDHVEGLLRPDRDALDAFLTHLWAVTVTGAPKRAAIEFLERHERDPRRWYGGAVGRIGFDGGLDTALTLRTIQMRDGIATVRAGATLLFDSDPDAEEQETLLKARALMQALEPGPRPRAPSRVDAPGPGVGRRVLLVDHQDSFVHTLADYLRQTGAQVRTFRSGFPERLLDTEQPDLLVLSPGPGRPHDFQIARTLEQARRRDIPVLGVCLGLQGLVEHLGGALNVLDRPVHGRSTQVDRVDDGGVLLAGLPSSFRAGRYHSLYANPDTLPAELVVTARSRDGVVMAVEHRSLPLAAVQFHPESILTQPGGCGHRIIANAVARLARQPHDAPPRPGDPVDRPTIAARGERS